VLVPSSLQRLSRSLSLSLSSALACAGCASGPARPQVAHPQFAAWTPGDESGVRAERPKEARKVTLQFELRGHAFPLPLVHGTVAGVPTWMLVDTGANSHVIAGWLARKVGLPLQRLGDVGTDHVGRTIPTFRVDHAGVVIDGWGPLADGPVLVTDVPEPIERLGIGAFVSPQSLAGGAAVILDFPAKEMRLAAYDETQAELVRLGQGDLLSPNGGVACEDTESPIKGLAYVVPATIEGQSVTLLIDTGAQRTDLLGSSRAGRMLTPHSVPNKEQMFAASGRVRTRTLKGAQVTVGGRSIHTDIDLMPGAPDPFCPRDGVVSMDVLSACVLVLGPGRMFGRCGP
jgi:predicted aspartyl protease